jgi:hypothetical protein
MQPVDRNSMAYSHASLEGLWGLGFFVPTLIKIKVGLEQRVKTDVPTKSRPTVGIGQVNIVSVHNINITSQHMRHI